MTTREDINVDYQPSPRVVEVASPSTELVLQDLIDTLRISEEGFAEGLVFNKLIDAAGKEDLGGGVLVGITANLQDAQVSFEARRTPAETGTVTTPSDAGSNGLQTFVDTSADFISAGITRGSLVINFTDNSIADVYEVTDLNTLVTRTLVNGSDNLFELGDSYQVFNIIQCNIAGGNLVAEDENEIQISSVVPTAFTQIVRTASSSATLSESQDIQYASFNGGVSVDTTNGISGTVFPTGTSRQPVGNWTDALAIATERGFSRFYIIGNTSISLSDDYGNCEFVGQSKARSTVTLDATAELTGSEFKNCTIQGTLDGENLLTDCNLLQINYVDGYIERCILNDVITLSGTGTAFFLDCYSGVPGSSTPTIDMGGSGSALAFRNYDGGIKLTNKTGTDSASLDFNSGQIIIDNSVDNGRVVLRGAGRWQNRETYTGNADIVDEMVRVDDIELIAFYERVEVDSVTGKSGTAYPTGTLGTPVNNLTDAYAIATTRGLNKLHFTSDFTIANEATWDGFTFTGESDNLNTITVDTTASTNGCMFRDCILSGVINGQDVHAHGVTVNSLSFKSGDFHDCGFRGTTSMIGTALDKIRIINCYGAGNPATDRPTFSLGLPLVTVVRYTGDMLLQNKSTGNIFASNIHGGRVELDSTITGGQYLVSGFGTLVDGSSGSTVYESLLTSDQGIVNKLNDQTYDGVSFEDVLVNILGMVNGKIVESSAGVFEFFKQDNTTPLFTLTKSGNIRSRS